MGLLRFLLALSVAWTHAGLPKGLSGDLCVTIFFAISGFYMAMVLSEKRVYDHVSTFYKQRLLRLLPMYWVLLVFSVLLGAVLTNQGWRLALSLDLPTNHLLLFAGWVLSQLFIVGQDVFLFLDLDLSGMLRFQPHMAAAVTPLAALNIISPAWSLSLEVVFYLMAPFIARCSTPRLLSLLALSIGIRLALVWGSGFVSDPWATRFFPSELSFFLVGMLGYRLVAAVNAPVLSASGLLYFAATVAVVSSLAANGFGRVNAGLLSAAASATLVLTAAIPWLFALTRRHRIDRAIGEYSYPLYLCHVFVFQLFALLEWSAPWAPYLMIACAVAFAALLTHSVDKPVDRFRHRLLKASR